jgi:hypothetical protein
MAHDDCKCLFPCATIPCLHSFSKFSVPGRVSTLHFRNHTFDPFVMREGRRLNNEKERRTFRSSFATAMAIHIIDGHTSESGCIYVTDDTESEYNNIASIRGSKTVAHICTSGIFTLVGFHNTGTCSGYNAQDVTCSPSRLPHVLHGSTVLRVFPNTSKIVQLEV